MVSPQDVQKLRETSGAGIMDCKRALQESSGDFEKAIQFLREKGKATAAKRSGKSTSSGTVACWVAPNMKKAGIIELNCETDFVARTKELNDFVKEVAQCLTSIEAGSVPELVTQSLASSQDSIDAVLKDKIGKVGENIVIKRIGSLGDKNSANSIIGQYVHAAYDGFPECGTLGVILELKSEKNDPEIQSLARELSMQVAANSPKWVKKEDVPESIVKAEKEIYQEQCKQSGKPEKAWTMITDGKLNDFYRQFCLLSQSYIRDPSGKVSVETVVEEASKKSGTSISVAGFFRFKVGEE